MTEADLFELEVLQKICDSGQTKQQWERYEWLIKAYWKEYAGEYKEEIPWEEKYQS